VELSYRLVKCHISDVVGLIKEHHPYGGAAKTCAHAFAVLERQSPVAAYLWMPPPPGAAKSVCPEAPVGVLALSRMVALPRHQRELNHVSKPLRRQMRRLIDRTRWPVLVTYSDESLGHTGHVYKCSGWEKTIRSKRPVFKDEDGNRTSAYKAGVYSTSDKESHGFAWIQRWEHWACERGRALEFMTDAGWRKTATGKTWDNGNPRHAWVKDEQLVLL
tara:strand:+ start:1305 stop:1958 length:654 start_codon:yes stop_codon:yes gene_type:complete